MFTMTFRRFAIVLLLSLGLAFIYATYTAMDNVAAEQSRVQQQAISPIYKLVRDELLRPLYIAETFASSVEFTTSMQSGELDETALLRRLQKMEEDLGLIFFVASEQTRKQYFSNGNTLNLVEGEVAWYFEAKASGKDFMADLGQVGDVHLFFDVKMYGDDREFLGYIGVGKRNERFLSTFNQYKGRFGYDLLFVNEANEIILSSIPKFVVTDAYIPTLDLVDGFPAGASTERSYDSEIVTIEQEDYLVSEFRIDELGWRLLLLVPLEARQAQITRAFIANALAAAFIVLLLAGIFLILTLLYKRSLEKKVEIDLLTGLPNRTYVQRHFNQLKLADEQLCAVMIDLDHFKAINDTYGHEAGDRVLKAAAETFRQQLRDKDIASRWGGEEFVMLIPATSIELGQMIAERSRQSIERLAIQTNESVVTITASFGVAFGSAREDSLEALIGRADDALYVAKQNGRNQVRLAQ
ncbi:MAG: sensor domain-containing diguanylate cyclase [Pseudomonadota bacterium]